MNAKHHRSRPRNPNPRPVFRPESPARAARGRKQLLVWVAVAACAGIAYAASGPLRARKTPANSGATQAMNVAQNTRPATPQPARPAPRPPSDGPRIEFASTTYNFGKAIGDDLVDCVFVFTNTGNALLEVSEVKPGCGCMKAGEWTKKVEPGRTGTIPVRYDSHHYNGYFAKSVLVTCNDAGMPSPTLEIKGTVWRPFEITPPSAVLTVSSEAPSNGTVVRIISHLDEPLVLSDLVNASSLGVELQTNTPGREFQLNVRTLAPWPTNSASGRITLKTSSTNAPVADIQTYLNFQPVVVALPYVVRLPPRP